MSVWSSARFYAVDPPCHDEVSVPGVMIGSIVTVVAEGELYTGHVCHVTMLSTVHDGGVRFDVNLGHHRQRRHFEHDQGITWIHGHHFEFEPDSQALLAAWKLRA